jgi:hypothetical protein
MAQHCAAGETSVRQVLIGEDTSTMPPRQVSIVSEAWFEMSSDGEYRERVYRSLASVTLTTAKQYK